MLFGQDLGGRHNRRLRALLGGADRGERGHYRFAGADVALQQAEHRPRFGQVVQHLGDDPALGAGQLKTEAIQQLPAELRRAWQRRGLQVVTLPMLPFHDQEMRRELVQRQPFARLVQLVGRRVRRGTVQKPGARVRGVAVDPRRVQHLRDQLTQPALRQSVRGRIHRYPAARN